MFKCKSNNRTDSSSILVTKLNSIKKVFTDTINDLSEVVYESEESINLKREEEAIITKEIHALEKVKQDTERFLANLTKLVDGD